MIAQNDAAISVIERNLARDGTAEFSTYKDSKGETPESVVKDMQKVFELYRIKATVQFIREEAGDMFGRVTLRATAK
ncbi:MAG: hypothetical protein WC651_00380 [Candidatus Gracilibacteria bacterium]|jgi:hypothetical protein